MNCEKPENPYADYFKVYTVNRNNNPIIGLQIHLLNKQDTLAADTVNEEGFAVFHHRFREENENFMFIIRDIDGESNGSCQTMRFSVNSEQEEYTFIVLPEDILHSRAASLSDYFVRQTELFRLTN